MSNVIDPFDDEYLKYDKVKHEYKGTPKLILDYSGVDLTQELDSFGDANESTLPQRFVDKASRLVYQLVYNHCGPSRRQLMQYIMAKNPDIRDYLKEWISEQVEYMLANGFVGLESGIDFGKLSSVNLSEIRGRRMYSPLVVDSMRSVGLLNTNYIYTIMNIEYEENNY